MLRPLDLEFGPRTRRASLAGLVLLLVAVAFVADLGVSYQGLRHSVAQKEERIARMDRPRDVRARPRGAPAHASPEEIAFARETIGRLSTPWDRLFRALEAGASDKVSVLAIEPDPRSGTVLISADGADYLAALSYVAELSRSSALSHVHLVKHELRPDNPPQRALSFSVSATWSSGRPDAGATAEARPSSPPAQPSDSPKARS
jgi:hypothetical protein